jgi:hypothetical protein
LAFTPIVLAQQPASTAWKLKGAQLKIGADSFIYEEKEYGPISIPTNPITSVCYDNVAHAPGPSAWGSQLKGDMRSWLCRIGTDGKIVLPCRPKFPLRAKWFFPDRFVGDSIFVPGIHWTSI